MENKAISAKNKITQLAGKSAMHDMKQASSETVIQWGRTTWRMRHARCLRLIAGKAEGQWQRERGKRSRKATVTSTYSK